MYIDAHLVAHSVDSYSRKGGMNRLIKIYHKNGKYGFSEPYEFDSVPALIDYFSSGHSLAEYNPDLNVSLSLPVKRVSSDGPV